MGYKAGYQNGTEDARNGDANPYAAEDILNLALESMKLSTRTLNCLLCTKYERIGDLANLSETNIYMIRNLGRKGADEIARALRGYGIRYTAWENYIL